MARGELRMMMSPWAAFYKREAAGGRQMGPGEEEVDVLGREDVAVEVEVVGLAEVFEVLLDYGGLRGGRRGGGGGRGS